MADTVASSLAYAVDLSRPITKTILRDVFVTEDSQAHTFKVSISREGEAVDLSGAQVTGYFMRYKDRVSIPLTGSVEGSKAVLSLSKPCYNYSTAFAVTICVKLGDVKHAVFVGEGQMFANRTDSIVDPEHIIPSVEEIVAQYDAMVEISDRAEAAAGDAEKASQQASGAAAAATNAASLANAAASRAPYVGDNGNWYVWDTAHGVYADTGIPAQGPQGAPGTGLKILDTYATLAALRAAVTDPQQGDMYNVGTAAPYSIYMWQSATSDWEYQGKLEGAKGDTGPYFTPSVDAEGNLSWSNTGGLANPETVNIKGSPGEPGADGEDGRTPEKGVDYWTEADKAEMVSDVLAALPTWNGGDY